MAGNTFGNIFKITTFGESHGTCIGVVVDGCPSGLPLTDIDFNEDLTSRIPSEPKIVSARKEEDKVHISSGVFGGVTTGAPIALIVDNKEVISKDYDLIKDLPRPGRRDRLHAGR